LILDKLILLSLASATASATTAAIFRFALKDRFVWKGSLFQLLNDAIFLLSNPLFIAGLAMFIFANVLWLLVLGSQKLSIAFSLQVGLVLIINSIFSAIFFGEYLSGFGYFGLLLIIAGVILVNL